MTEPERMEPFLEAVQQFTRRMADEHGFEQVHMFDPNGPTTADVLRALDPQPSAPGGNTWTTIAEQTDGAA